MASSKWQTWAIEKRIYSLLSADGVLWTNIVGNLFEGAIPLGVATRQPAIFGVMRDVSLEDHRSIMHDAAAPASKALVAWNIYDYEVVITGETESYGDLAGNADRVYTDLHNTKGTVDGDVIYLDVVGTVKKRYIRDGRVFKEIGHKVRALVMDSSVGWIPSNSVWFFFGAPGAEVDLMPFASTIHWDRVIDANGVDEHSRFTIEGFVHEGGNTLTNLMVDLNTANKNFIYGPYGNGSGKRMVTSGTNAASMKEFEFIHGAEVSSGAALGPISPLRWRCVIESPVSQFGVFP